MDGTVDLPYYRMPPSLPISSQRPACGSKRNWSQEDDSVDDKDHIVAESDTDEKLTEGIGSQTQKKSGRRRLMGSRRGKRDSTVPPSTRIMELPTYDQKVQILTIVQLRYVLSFDYICALVSGLGKLLHMQEIDLLRSLDLSEKRNIREVVFTTYGSEEDILGQFSSLIALNEGGLVEGCRLALAPVMACRLLQGM